MSEQSEPSEYLYKVLVVGEGSTGKTCIIRRYVHNIYQANTKSTIGVDFALKVLNWDKSRNITLQIWDIAGQERYGQMTRVYYQAAVGALVVYDVSRNESFESVVKWKEDIDKKVFLPDNSHIPCILLANKCDLPAVPERTQQQLDAFCRQHGFAGWFATSSKENLGIDKAFRFLVEKILENDTRLEPKPEPVVNPSVKLGKQQKEKESGCKC